MSPRTTDRGQPLTDKQFEQLKKKVTELAGRENVGNVRQLSGLLGVRPSTVSRYLSQNVQPPAKRIIQLAAIDALTSDDDASDEQVQKCVKGWFTHLELPIQTPDHKVRELIALTRKRLLGPPERQPQIKQQWTFDLQEFEEKDLQINVKIVDSDLVVELQVSDVDDLE